MFGACTSTKSDSKLVVGAVDARGAVEDEEEGLDLGLPMEPKSWSRSSRLSSRPVGVRCTGPGSRVDREGSAGRSAV